MGKIQPEILSAYSHDGEAMDCMRCQKRLHMKDVAMMIRTRPTDAFNAWCPACTRWVMLLAASQLDEELPTPLVVLF